MTYRVFFKKKLTFCFALISIFTTFTEAKDTKKKQESPQLKKFNGI